MFSSSSSSDSSLSSDSDSGGSLMIRSHMSVKESAKSAEKKAAVKPTKKPDFAEAQVIVTVNVKYQKDDTTQPFRVHLDFLCHYSPYFDAMFKGSFTKSETLVSDLDDTPPEAFSLFINWIYSQKIEVVVDETDKAVRKESAAAATGSLIHLWILADRLLVPRLQNQALDELHRIENKYYFIDSSLFHRVYEHTEKHSPLRRFLLTWFAENARYSTSDPSRFPAEMLVDIIATMRCHLLSLKKPASKKIVTEIYHVSEDVIARKRNPGVLSSSSPRARELRSSSTR